MYIPDRSYTDHLFKKHTEFCFTIVLVSNTFFAIPRPYNQLNLPLNQQLLLVALNSIK